MAANTAAGLEAAAAVIAGELGSDDLAAPSHYEEETEGAEAQGVRGDVPSDGPGGQPSITQVIDADAADQQHACDYGSGH